MAFIKITAIGNVGRDPVINTLPSGQPVANFSIASTEKWKDKQTQEMHERTTWLRCSVIGGLAEVVAKYVFQGSKLYLEGTLKTGKYVKNGDEHESFEMRVTELDMLGEPRGAGQQQGGYQQPQPDGGHQQHGGRQQPLPQQGGHKQQIRQQPHQHQSSHLQQPHQQHGNGYQQRSQQGGYQQQGEHNQPIDFNDM
ncbi:single-stranded DNA-binding protein [Rheinheimera hassiensis]|uniref:single-stranded DNA-binding protein n=1 Tax=Rheinheimera hassiensis TaxID=1193627 RepID=UPI001F05DECB|nr:single-stranded DNA-binding protein [Rheinheimera hassiensis]